MLPGGGGGLGVSGVSMSIRNALDRVAVRRIGVSDKDWCWDCVCVCVCVHSAVDLHEHNIVGEVFGLLHVNMMCDNCTHTHILTRTISYTFTHLEITSFCLLCTWSSTGENLHRSASFHETLHCPAPSPKDMN